MTNWVVFCGALKYVFTLIASCTQVVQFNTYRMYFYTRVIIINIIVLQRVKSAHIYLKQSLISCTTQQGRFVTHMKHTPVLRD